LIKWRQVQASHPIEERTIRRLEGCHITSDDFQVFETAFRGPCFNELLRSSQNESTPEQQICSNEKYTRWLFEFETDVMRDFGNLSAIHSEREPQPAR
jgi:hypothetical protein